MFVEINDTLQKVNVFKYWSNMSDVCRSEKCCLFIWTYMVILRKIVKKPIFFVRVNFQVTKWIRVIVITIRKNYYSMKKLHVRRSDIVLVAMAILLWKKKIG